MKRTANEKTAGPKTFVNVAQVAVGRHVGQDVFQPKQSWNYCLTYKVRATLNW